MTIFGFLGLFAILWGIENSWKGTMRLFPNILRFYRAKNDPSWTLSFVRWMKFCLRVCLKPSNGRFEASLTELGVIKISPKIRLTETWNEQKRNNPPHKGGFFAMGIWWGKFFTCCRTQLKCHLRDRLKTCCDRGDIVFDWTINTKNIALNSFSLTRTVVSFWLRLSSISDDSLVKSSFHKLTMDYNDC